MVSWDTHILSSPGNSAFSHPEICSGDQSSTSLLATRLRTVRLRASKHGFGRSADPHASSSAALARYALRPPYLTISRLTVDAARPIRSAIERPDSPEAMPREM